MLPKKFLTYTLMSLSALSLASYVYADPINDAGIYLGLQGGWAKADYGNYMKNAFQQLPNYNISEGDIGGRALIGLQVNPFLAIEGGYSIFPNNTYSGNDSFGDSLSLTTKTRAWDIVGKAILPFSQISNTPDNPFSLYVKGGAAYVQAKGEGSITVNNQTISNSNSTNQWEPVAGAGISYNFTKNFAADVSYTHYFGSDSQNSLETPNIDFVAFGLNYRFNFT